MLFAGTLNKERNVRTGTVQDLSRHKISAIMANFRCNSILCAINDPLGQTHRSARQYRSLFSLESFDCEILKSWDGRTVRKTDVQTTLAKIVTTAGRDCGSASWIN